jgi:hypothetical protein
MLKDALEWREEVGADHILEDIEQTGSIDLLFYQVISDAFHKYDKQGRPIYIQKTGAINMSEMEKRISHETLVRRHIWYMERQIDAMKRSPQHLRNGGTERVERLNNIIDLKGLSLMPSFATINAFQETTRIDQLYYPERMGKMIIIRAPMIFWGFWKIISPLLDSVTKEKIVILGNNFEEALLELIDADQLPEEYGGTCACPGGCIRQYYDKKVDIGARSKHIEILEVGQEGGTVSWSFKCVGYDINFEIILENSSGEESVLLPRERYHSSAMECFDGNVLSEAGTITLIFDNSYSYLTSKTVHYKVTLD